MGGAKHPQNADEFISAYNWGGIWQNKERIAVERPFGAVVADIKEYAKKCLDINVNQKRAGRYALDKYGSGTRGGPVTYNTKVAPIKSGATALSVQEELGDKGAPPEGMFTLVAEIQGAGRSKTEVNIYHLARPFLADPLKKWIQGDKRDCPGL